MEPFRRGVRSRQAVVGVSGQALSGDEMDRGVFSVEEATSPAIGAKRALVVFLVFASAQLVAGAVIGFSAALWYVLAYGPGSQVVSDVQRAVAVPAALAGEIIGGMAALRMARRTLPGPIASGALRSIGWSPARSRDLLLASAAGIALALLYVFGLVPLVLPSPGKEWGPLTSAVSSGGWPLHAWAVLAVVVAPPVEEFVFRGVLFSGVRQSWRLGSAGALVTVLFVAAHFSEVASYGPAVIGVALVGVATLVARVATRSLGPAIALHLSYNLVLVVVTYVSAA